MRHTDTLVKAKLEKQRLLLHGKTSSQAEERKFRPWYCSAKKWGLSSSSSSRKVAPGETSQQQETALISSATGNGIKASNEPLKEYIVPADEHFVRCPVSKETFDKVWDDCEGGLMYRNAVKVLVTEVANKKLYDLGFSTSVEGIHYMIVRKPLIVDGWIASGLSASLQETIQRYQAMGKDKISIQRLESAAGDDAGSEDTFVMLELVS